MDNGQTMDKALELIKKHEGLKLKPYICLAGKLTIGYGRNLEDKGISGKEAHYMALNDIMECIGDLIRIFPEWGNFSVNRQAALIDMVYNLGAAGFARFRNTIAFILERDWDQAAGEMLRSQWAKQVGNRAIELSKMVREG